jgi:hypothetical protein
LCAQVRLQNAVNAFHSSTAPLKPQVAPGKLPTPIKEEAHAMHLAHA